MYLLALQGSLALRVFLLSNYRFAYFKSNIPFITNNKNATTTAYASRVTAKNNTRTIPSIIDIPVMVLSAHFLRNADPEVSISP